HQRVTLNSVMISGESDADDPSANTSNITMQKSNGGAAVESNGWTNGQTPYFAWDAGDDEGAGLYGDCLYLGQTQDSDPITTKGILSTSPLPTAATGCQSIVPSNSVDLATEGLIGTPLATSNNPYHLYVKAI